MKSILPCLTSLAFVLCPAAGSLAAPQPGRALAPVGAPTADASSASAGDRLLLQSLAQLERRRSVVARIRHQVNLDGKQFYGIGTYWQQGSGDDLRVRLELQIAGQKTSLLQVSNGRFLWTDRRLPTGRTVTRIDLRKLRADPALASAELEEIQPGQASWSAVEPASAAVRGGLPMLFSSLVEHFTFGPPQAMRLSIAPPLAAQPTNIPVFVVVGRWRPETLAQLLPDVQLSSLPQRFPQEVLLLVGQADLFPYRIEYRRVDDASSADGSLPTTPYQLSTKPTIVMALSDVVFDVPIAAGQFDFSSGDSDWTDRTAEYAQRLQTRRQQERAARRGVNPAAPRAISR